MQILSIIFIYFLMFLFFVYIYARFDQVLVRKNITLDQVFDLVILSCLIALLGARLGFILLHPRPIYLNPLVSLVFPYYPGLSFSAGIIAALPFLISKSRTKKLPTARLTDILSLSALAGLIPIHVAQFLLSLMRKNFSLVELIFTIFYLIAFFTLNFMFKKGWKEGGVTFIIILIFALSSIVSTSFEFHNNSTVLLKENIYSILIIVGLLLTLLRQSNKNTPQNNPI